MKKHLLVSLLVLLAGAGLLLVGCESLNGPDSATDTSLSLTESFDVTALDSQTSLLKSAGVNTDSASAFFVLRWTRGLERFQNSDTVLGHASAVAYEKPATLRDRNAVGLDMGTASVLIGQNKLDLPKLTSALFGVRYGLFGGPHGGPKRPLGGHGGPRDAHGPRGGHGDSRPNQLTIVNIPFVGGSAYQFNVTGSTKVAAMTLNINAPSKLAQITGFADRDSIDATQDLTITWDGDASANNTVLVLAPARKPGRGELPVTPIFQAVSSASGSHTFTAQAVQALLSQSNAKAFSVHLSQGNLNEINDATLGKILVSAGADDRVLLKVQ
jgi:hypothetical protein